MPIFIRAKAELFKLFHFDLFFLENNNKTFFI